MRTALVLLAAVALVAAPAPVPAADDDKIAVPARSYVTVQEKVSVTDPATGRTEVAMVPKQVPVALTVALEPKKTAVIVCDMWDDHWCKKASERCGELAKRAEVVLKSCREHGMTIIHCPSDTMAFYKDHAARKRTLAVKKVEPPKSKDLPNPPLPVDDSDGGCDDEKPAKQHRAWTRQHAAITIDADKDYITDNGGEAYNVLKDKGIDTVLVMGVHTNMCVLNRSFAIKQMVKWGVRTYLVRDLTDAMYNPKMKPMVSHDAGTQLIIGHIEKHWCPTVESKSLVK